MASQNIAKLRMYIPLWKRRIPKYPLYVERNPQLRVFLPLFWIKLIRQKKSTPDTAKFEVHPQMTDIDIKNYLERIYDVKVLSVNSKLLKGEWMKSFGPGFAREDNKRIAYVQLDEEFKFPELFKEQKTQESKSIDDYAKMSKDLEKDNRKNWDKSDVPEWFR